MGRARLEYYDYITEKVLEDIPKWKQQGMTDEWIAAKIGIGLTTMKKWKKEKAEFDTAFAKGREELLQALEGTLVKMGLGTMVQKKKKYLKNVESGKIIGNTVEITEEFIQSSDSLKLALAVYDSKRFGKKALEGEKEDNKGRNIVFGGEDEVED